MGARVARACLIGQTYGRLTVTDISPSPGKVTCKCECGRMAEVRASHMKRGAISSCGCLRAPHGMSDSPTHKSWDAMIQRCTNPKNRNYPMYGGAGVGVCERWRRSFVAFLEDMGVRPEGKTLDRLDNEDGYHLDNCRWATRAEQQQNRRLTRLNVELVADIRRRHANGETGRSIAESMGIGEPTVSMIINGRIWKNA